MSDLKNYIVAGVFIGGILFLIKKQSGQRPKELPSNKKELVEYPIRRGTISSNTVVPQGTGLEDIKQVRLDSAVQQKAFALGSLGKPMEIASTGKISLLKRGPPRFL